MLGLLLLGGAEAGACVPPRVAADDPAYRAEIERFQQAREARSGPIDGWLTVSGLCWLKPGPNRIGADPASEVALRSGAPAAVGVLTLPSDDPRRRPGFSRRRAWPSC